MEVPRLEIFHAGGEARYVQQLQNIFSAHRLLIEVPDAPAALAQLLEVRKAHEAGGNRCSILAMTKRHLEIDLLRSIAVVSMVFYHGAYDLEHFFGIPVLSRLGAWDVLWARSTLCLFLFLVGVSFSISWQRSDHRHIKYLVRGLELLCCAMLVTLVTYIVDTETFVRFGVLHMIAVSIVLLPFCAPLKEWAVLPACVLLLLPAVVFAPYFPVGFLPHAFNSVDYVPMIPWFGVVLLGYAVGCFLYIRMGMVIPWKHPRPLRVMGIPGRYALFLYMLHQPLLLGGAEIVRLFL